MQPDRYARVLEQIESHGYTLDRLNRTPQLLALPSGE
jgi:hypothetical protein